MTLTAVVALACLPVQAADAKPTAEAEPALPAIAKFIEEKGIDTSRSGWKGRLPLPPMVEFAPDLRYVWNLETSEGPIRVRLMPDVAPMHVSSTIYLTQLGFYDGITFHRVIPGFMAQGGCPNGDGRGSPGYKYDGEFSPKVRHDRPGRLSMANAGPGTDGSQFFLTFVPTPHLDDKHTIFGEVISGYDALYALEGAGSPGGPPTKPLSITKATIVVEQPAELASSPDDADPALGRIAEFIASKAIDRAEQEWRTRLPMPPQLDFASGKTWYWNVRTNVGTLRIRLMPDVAPMHVSSTVYLARLGFFDGLTFHRVIPKFMAQGGDPVGNGTGGPGYKFAGEFSPSVRHDRGGLLSMANAGPGTDGSQFFLTFVPTPHLDDKHTIYGEVVEGKDVLKDLEALAGTQRDGGRPKMPLVMEATTIEVE